MTNRTYNKPFQLYLNSEDKQEASTAAKERGISLSGLLRMILRDFLEKNRDKKD